MACILMDIYFSINVQQKYMFEQLTMDFLCTLKLYLIKHQINI